jgi:hypothetical protein
VRRSSRWRLAGALLLPSFAAAASTASVVACSSKTPSSAPVLVEAGTNRTVPTPGDDDDGGGRSSDGAAPSTRCTNTTPFGLPVAITELNSRAKEADVRLTADELVAYFSRDDTTIFRATRASHDAKFGVPVAIAVTGLKSAFSPSPLTDEAQLYFESEVDGGYGLFFATHLGDASFGKPELLPKISPAEAKPIGAYISADENEILFARIVADGGTSPQYGLWQATRGLGDFSDTAPLMAAASPGGDVQPVLSADGLTLYFYSDRENSVGSGSTWMAERTDAKGAFGPPQIVDELSTLDGSDGPIPDWISPDNCRIYLHQGVAGTGTDLFVAERPLPSP